MTVVVSLLPIAVSRCPRRRAFVGRGRGCRQGCEET